MSDLINALKRLERAGDEHSRATTKLHAAVRKIAEFIEDQCPAHVPLPRGYMVNEGERYMYLTRDLGPAKYPYSGESWERDWQFIDRRQTRESSLQFAKDIAEGLLEEIAAFLEERTQEAEQAAVLLESKAILVS